jgi:ATP-dependent DNA helicase RecG
MNRLLQGDVGSGKTMVALLAMLLAMDNGFQSCMMAYGNFSNATF